jgi:glycosyltransferase involved in cell wall biosynthesis
MECGSRNLSSWTERKKRQAGALLAILQDPGLGARLAAGGRETVQRYAWPVLARRILQLYAACRDESGQVLAEA